MENRCQRCNRELSDPKALFGWRCAEILGVKEMMTTLPREVYERFEQGVLNANSLLNNSNISLTDERKKDFFKTHIKMALWNGINEQFSKKARNDSYAVLLGTNKKIENLPDTLEKFNSYLKEHEAYYDKDGILFNGSNMAADAMWNSAAFVLDKVGYKLCADLVRVSASKDGKHYYAGEGSYASNLLKKDAGIIKAVKAKIRKGALSGKIAVKDEIKEYKIPLGNGDLGAALHKVSISIDARRQKNGKWNADIVVSDKFDFTKFVKFWEEESLKEKFLWAANDWAYFNQKARFIKPIQVKIHFNDTYKIWSD